MPDLIAVLCELEYVQRDSPGWAARTMHKQADALGRFPRECGLSATRADLRRNMFNQHAPAIQFQHFAHELLPGGLAAADVALER